MFFVYILQSEKTGKYYIGHTNDPERRLKEHNESMHHTFTSKHRPWKLMALIPVDKNRGNAMKLEKHIKGKKRRSFIDELIEKQKDNQFIEALKRMSSAG